MRTIGIRAAPKAVTFVIFDSKERCVLNVEEIRVPAAFQIPDALKYIRSNLLDILREYDVEKAGIRVTEPSAQSMSIERIQIEGVVQEAFASSDLKSYYVGQIFEGVVQEAFASSDLKSYYVGQISSISKRLGFERARFKPLVLGENDLEIEGWEKLSKEAREAMLCAMGAEDA